jgi:hypothetical protein
MKFRAESPEAKRRAANWLRENNPEMLEWLLAVARVFGPVKSVVYRDQEVAGV